MTALDLSPSVRVEPPLRLAVDYLSLSSLKSFMACPEKWRRHYIEKEPEPPSGKMVLGSAAGAALAQHYGTQIESGEGISTEQLLDEFSTEWDDRTGREPVEYGSDVPGELKDTGARALSLYHSAVAPNVEPVAVEREFELSWPGVEWKLTGFLDLETTEGQVIDYKLSAKRMSERDAAADLQPTTYLVARRAEGDPANGFAFHVMARTRNPTVEIVPAPRTELQLDLLTSRVFTLAVEIDWRCQTGIWSGAAPGTLIGGCSGCRYPGCPLRLGSL